VSWARVIVDVQHDFADPAGALAVPGGEAVVPRIAKLLAAGRYDLVVATRDWHPPDHASFAPQGGPWPVHCVQGTPGAELHPGLDPERIDLVFDKGKVREADGYSAFEDGRLAAWLHERRIDHLTLVGLATDYCVKQTALDALRAGFGVTVDSTAVRGVDVRPGDATRALEELRAAGASVM
jgi:nicotinamidase/pyrazinamidase